MIAFNNIYLDIQRDNGQVVRIQASKAVDEMGAGKGIDIVDTKIERFWSVD